MSKGHSHTITEELACHFPYGVFSVAFSLIIASLLMYFSYGMPADVMSKGTYGLFHSFHFLHIVFAATGATLTYFRFSKNYLKGCIIGMINAAFFCILSDALLPYWGGRLFGVTMDLHICFISELQNVLPFLLIGCFNGFVLSKHSHSEKTSYSLWSHFAHIFVSSFASTLYLISHGFNDWHHYMGFVFTFLVFAVVVPCTMSDVVVPMFFAKGDAK